MKAFIVDTLATVIFFTVVAGLTELFIVGMEPSQVLIARLITIPLMILTGRAYGLWRDWVFARVTPRGVVPNIATDIFAFLIFQVPVYIATLLIAGATIQEMQVAVGAAVVFMLLLSRPFGLFLEILRVWAGTTVHATKELLVSDP